MRRNTRRNYGNGDDVKRLTLRLTKETVIWLEWQLEAGEFTVQDVIIRLINQAREVA
jgi:hypothetical protein